MGNIFEVIWKNLGMPCESCFEVFLKNPGDHLDFVFKVVWKYFENPVSILFLR